MSIVVLTGGPCGGKSSCLAKIKDHFMSKGYMVFCIPEMPVLLKEGGCPNPGVENNKMLIEFEVALLQAQLQMENSFKQIAKSTGHKYIIIADRGIMDIAAYMNPEDWAYTLTRAWITELDIMQRYDAVIHLVTAADGAPDHYKFGNVTDDNGVAVFRCEPPELAVELDKKIKAAWSKHEKHVVVGNDVASFQEKIDKVIRSIE
jgi:hypothetical protein